MRFPQKPTCHLSLLQCCRMQMEGCCLACQAVLLWWLWCALSFGGGAGTVSGGTVNGGSSFGAGVLKSPGMVPAGCRRYHWAAGHAAATGATLVRADACCRMSRLLSRWRKKPLPDQ